MICMWCQRVCALYLFLNSSRASPSNFPSPEVLEPDRAKQLFFIMDNMSARPPSDWETDNKEENKETMLLPTD